MNWHFIYPDINTGFYPDVHHGLAQLSAALKNAGHKVSLHHVTKEPTPKDILSAVQRETPDIVGFTTMTNQMGYVTQWSKWIKNADNRLKIVCGGVHATLNTAELLTVASIDEVCKGEGEKAVLEQNFWRRADGYCVPGKTYLLSDLDELPFPDYSLFDCAKLLKARGGAFSVMVSRGCPYSCNNCCNQALRDEQKGLGRYFRYRSVDNVMEMLSLYKSQYPVEVFSFADDIFGADKKWTIEFCDKYPSRIGLPFMCNLRVEMVSPELLGMLKRAGCVVIEMGIESGNEQIRTEILNRIMTNQQIVDAFDMARELGIKTRAYNMVGLPHETREMVRETIELNWRANPDQVAVFYFYPYKGTKLFDLCKEEGLISRREATGYVDGSVLDLPTITRKELDKVYNEFYRLSADKEIRNYPMIVKCGYRVVATVLRIVTGGREARSLKEIYIRMFGVLRRLRA